MYTKVKSPFDDGFRHSGNYANYGVETYLNKTTEKESSTDNTNQQPSLKKGTSSDVFIQLKDVNEIFENTINDISTLDKTVVDTVTIPNQNKHQRLKTAIVVGGSALVLGGLSLVLTKGKIPKFITKGIGKLSDNITKKIEEITNKPTISTFEGKYLSFLQKTNNIALKARGTFFNITPLKDTLFKKLCNKLGLTKPCNAITEGFRKISFSTVKSAYKKTSRNIDEMSSVFYETNRKIANGEYSLKGEHAKTLSEQLDKRVSSIKKSYHTNFGESEVEKRSKDLVEGFSNLSEQVYDKAYGNMKEFINDVDMWTSFISERLAKPKKLQFMSELSKKRRIITNNPQDNYKILSENIAKLEKTINPEDKTSLNTLKRLKELSKQYINLSGRNETEKRKEIISLINKNLSEIKDLTVTDLYRPEKKKILEEIAGTISQNINNDKKGEVEELLTIYKEILPKDEYNKVKMSAQRATNSLNKAVYREGFEYVDKVRDLSVGSALTDVAIGMAVPIISTSIAVSAADTKEKKRSVVLKYGIPLIAGMATATTCTIRLISGGNALILGGLVSIMSNEICERIDNYLLSKNKSKTES